MSRFLEIEGLSGGYMKGFRTLQDISFSADKGEAVAIIGLNGSGKSTLGRAIMNLLPWRSGSIRVEGVPYEKKSTHELVMAGFAIMHQGGTVFPNLSVRDNLSLAWGKNPDSQYRKELEETIPLLSSAGGSWMTMSADKLSGGQRLELALAMTLARKPKLVILDEPSAGLAPDAIEAAYAILTKIKQRYGATILLIEQNFYRAYEFCDRCALMQSGSKIQDLTGKDITEIESIIFHQ